MRRGPECRGRAGQRGAVRAATGEGARREGAEAGPPEGGAGRGGEGAGEGRRRGGSPRGGDGEESGKQGPVGAGVLTSLRGRRPLPVPVAPSEARAAPRRPRLPSALPRRAGPRPAGRFPPRAPRPLLVQAPAFKRFGLLTQPLRLSRGLASSALLGAEKGTGTGLEAKTALERGTKGQRPEWRWDRGRARAKRRALCGGRLCVPSAVPSPS